jgi:hypothetical protein
VGLFTLQAATEAQTKAFGDDIGAGDFDWNR